MNARSEIVQKHASAGLASPRLTLRSWTGADGPAFARLHSVPEVIRDFEAPLNYAESLAKLGRYRQNLDERGFGRWAVCIRQTGELIGYAGVQPIRADLPVAPGFEICWRMFRRAWGHGYATEAARLALGDAFSSFGLTEVHSFTGIANVRSEAVMQRLGMQRCPDKDFVYPDKFNTACVVYRAISEAYSRWRGNQG